MKAKQLLLCIPVILFAYTNSFAQTVKLGREELKNLVGCWQGTLTYLDYTTNNPFSMSANLDVKQAAKTDTFFFANSYPNEPQANSIDTVTISNKGTRINKEAIISKRRLADGTLEIVSELAGIDGNDNKPAKFRFTYLISATMYSQKKEVQFTGDSTWIKRHEYSYERCK